MRSNRKCKDIGTFKLTISAQNNNNKEVWRFTVYVELNYLPRVSRQQKEVKCF